MVDSTAPAGPAPATDSAYGAGRPASAGGPTGDAVFRRQADAASVPLLLMVLHQFTGDEKWLSAPYLPTRPKGLDDNESGGLPTERQVEVREAAAEVLAQLAAGVPPAMVVPDDATVARMLGVCMGETISGDYGPMLAGELRKRLGIDTGADTVAVTPPPGFRVIVVGIGVAGVIAAHQLLSLGVDFTMYEKQPRAGGVWLQNSYPGAGVDTPSHLYSYSFAPHDWRNHYELRDDLQSYFAEALDRLQVADRIHFDTEVLSARFVSETSLWEVEVRHADGSVQVRTANVVISAVGVLNRPKLPDVPGSEEFTGPSFHTSSWPADFSFEGTHVAVVGAGASAMQVAPAIAPHVARLSVFQRSPHWVAPFAKFQEPIAEPLRDLIRECPAYYGWYWLRLFWLFGDRVIRGLRVDPEWEFPDRSINRRNESHRRFLTDYIEQQLEGREDLLPQVVPDYPPYGKRMLLDNGWYSMLRRDNVTLIGEAVRGMTSRGIVTETGAEHPVDAVVWATGFQASRFLASFTVTGRDGLDLRDFWDDDDPQAYLGVAIPNFPNLFLLGGPNSFPGSGSFMYVMEVQMRYIAALIREMVHLDISAIAVKQSVSDDYNERVVAQHQASIWTHLGMSTYYRNARGRVVFVMPFLNLDYWELTHAADLENYETSSA